MSHAGPQDHAARHRGDAEPGLLPWWASGSVGLGLGGLLLGLLVLAGLEVAAVPTPADTSATPALENTAAEPRSSVTSRSGARPADDVRPAASAAVLATDLAAERLAKARSKALATLDQQADRRHEELVEARERRIALAAQRRAEAEARRLARSMAAASAPSGAAGSAVGQWLAPTSGYRITAEFGETSGLWASIHTGLDMAAPTGTPVVAPADGVVSSAQSDGAYGLKVVVLHADGTETWYAHLSSAEVAAGDSVVQGQAIGAVGTSGNSTGPHLHLEVRPSGGEPVDPAAFFLERGVDL